MSVVVISPSNVVTFPEGGGHFWVYMQYVQALRQLGCDVYWLERFFSSGSSERDKLLLSTFYKRMERYGLGGKVILYMEQDAISERDTEYEYIGVWSSEAQKIFRRAELLLNFYYNIHPTLLSCFRRTALIDIDPGLLQFWISVGQLAVPQHDLYFSTGETVGTPNAKFSDCGLNWMRIRPPVCLELWPYIYDPDSVAFTTVSGWWGADGKGEWITDGRGIFYENNKRVSFMQFVEIPRLTDQVLELALCLGDGDVEDDTRGSRDKGAGSGDKGAGEDRGDRGATTASSPSSPVSPAPLSPYPAPSSVTDYKGDAQDQEVLKSYGWQIRHTYEMAGSPEKYQSYIQMSRGEFSCAKPSCMKFQNAWISDRTLCYLASGKPVVVQHTGPSSYLPNGEGMFRFSTLSEAADALATINANYEKHCRAAREIAETYFDAKQTLENILNSALERGSRE